MVEELKSRKCTRCGIEKPLDQMVASKAYRGGYMPFCKPCRACYWRERYKENPDARQRHTDTVLRSKILRQHGITPADYDQMVVEQGDKCALCGGEDRGRSTRFRTWNIDHSHKTNRVRGLLCHNCNIALGWFERLTDQIGHDRVMEYLARS